MLTFTDQICRLQRDGRVEHDFSVFCVPRRTLVLKQILEDEGITGDVRSLDFPLLFLPLDDDVLSLELDGSFGDLYLNKDSSCIHVAARALMQVQRNYGLFPRIIGKGDNSKKLTDQLFRMRREFDAEDTSSLVDGSGKELLVSPTIENLIIIDRDVDFATVLLRQLTYEGLVDELFHISNNTTEVDSKILGPSIPAPSSQAASSAPQHGLKKKVQLDSSDTLFSQLRDSNFAIVGSILNRVARRLEGDYERRHFAKSTAELREFVNKLPAYQAEHTSLKVHTNIAEEIMRFTRSHIFRRELEVQQNIVAGADPTYQHGNIEELIARNVHLPTVLRLLCIESCVNGGIRPRDLEHFKKLILQAYGYQHLITLDALEKMGLLLPRSSATALLLPIGGAAGDLKTNYSHLRRALCLIVDEVNEQQPDDIAYVYSGYAPLSIRLLQCVLQGQYILSLFKGTAAPAAIASATNFPSRGWLGFEDVVATAKGETVNRVQKSAEKVVRARQTVTGNNGAGDVKTVYVFFLGGVTFTEIAALRFMAQQEAGRRRIVICTTGVISGNRMMEEAIQTSNCTKR